MKKLCFIVLVSLTVMAGSLFSADLQNEEVVEKLRIQENEIPDGFTYGKVPSHAREIFADNPWMLNTNSVQNLAGRIYPGGDFNSMEAVHVTIIADSDDPERDDIVCYILVYKNNKMAENEIEKLKDFAGYYQDRAIVLTHKNIAVYMHVSRKQNFHHMEMLSKTINEKIKSL